MTDDADRSSSIARSAENVVRFVGQSSFPTPFRIKTKLIHARRNRGSSEHVESMIVGSDRLSAKTRIRVISLSAARNTYIDSRNLDKCNERA